MFIFDFIDTIIVRPITNVLFLIYNLVGDFGLAIILFVIIVKLCMWPLVKRQLHQTKLMRQLQPELAQIKKTATAIVNSRACRQWTYTKSTMSNLSALCSP